MSELRRIFWSILYYFTISYFEFKSILVLSGHLHFSIYDITIFVCVVASMFALDLNPPFHFFKSIFKTEETRYSLRDAAFKNPPVHRYIPNPSPLFQSTQSLNTFNASVNTTQASVNQAVDSLVNFAVQLNGLNDNYSIPVSGVSFVGNNSYAYGSGVNVTGTMSHAEGYNSYMVVPTAEEIEENIASNVENEENTPKCTIFEYNRLQNIE